MIGYLRGKILDQTTEGKLLVDVGSGEAGGVGYAVSIPMTSQYLSLSAGEPIELYVHTHVREDALDLYGFTAKIEKEIFLTLLTVNGIGPKGALGILSKIEPAHLLQAIINGDKDSLTQIPGIGKKTAERVVLELGDSIRKKADAGVFATILKKDLSPQASAKGSTQRGAGATLDRSEHAIVRDAKSALVSLGYREHDVGSLLNRVLAAAETPPKDAEELIRSALRQL